MARTAVTVETIDADGLNATYTAAHVDGHKAVWSRDLAIHVKAPQNRVVTIITPGLVSGLAIADRVVTVPSSGELFINLGDPAYVQNDGMVYWDYDATTTTTVAVVRMGIS